MPGSQDAQRHHHTQADKEDDEEEEVLLTGRLCVLGSCLNTTVLEKQ